MDTLAHHDNDFVGHQYGFAQNSYSTSLGRWRQNFGVYQPSTITPSTIFHPIQSLTPQESPITTQINAAGFVRLDEKPKMNKIPIEQLNKAIETDEFLKEFFSTSRKLEHMPTLEQIKEQYYSR